MDGWVWILLIILIGLLIWLLISSSNRGNFLSSGSSSSSSSSSSRSSSNSSRGSSVHISSNNSSYDIGYMDPFSSNFIEKTIVLTGSEEVPQVSTPARGTSVVSLSPDRKTLNYKIDFSGLSTPFTAAHFHSGARGVAGPISKTITQAFRSSNPNRTAGTIQGTWTASDSELLNEKNIRELLAGNQYINIHTQKYPDGEIRGQVTL